MQLFLCFTKTFHRTIAAFRTSCGANVTSEVYDSVAKIRLQWLVDTFIEYFFDFRRILFAFGIKAETSADADAMCVGDDIRLTENVAEHQICNFASHTREHEELIHGRGNFTAKIIYYHFGGFFYAFCFSLV